MIHLIPKFHVPYTVADHAPTSLAEIVSVYTSTGRLVVWSGASDQTVWQSPEANWLFRAWHDYTHILGMHEFDTDGEIATARRQIAGLDDHAAQLVWSEIVGQLEYFNKFGKFPADQVKYTLNYMEGVKL